MHELQKLEHIYIYNIVACNFWRSGGSVEKWRKSSPYFCTDSGFLFFIL